MKPPNDNFDEWFERYKNNAKAKGDEPTRLRRNDDKVRLVGEARKRAEFKDGGSASARLALAFEERIGKPIKVNRKDWHLYSKGKWKYVGKD